MLYTPAKKGFARSWLSYTAYDVDTRAHTDQSRNHQSRRHEAKNDGLAQPSVPAPNLSEQPQPLQACVARQELALPFC